MASAGAFPAPFAEIHPRFKSPGFGTLTMGAVSILWFVFLRCFSKNVLDDSIEALGLCVAFYYGLTAFACVIVYRRQLLKSVRNFVFMGALPAIGGAMMVFLLIESCLSLARKAPPAAFGIGLPLGIASASLVTGIILMFAARKALPGFFRRTAFASV
jgi:amino acid transporter